MEVAGLGIGIAGLVGLFSSCLEAIDKVKDYKSSTFDPDALNVQFDAERLRLQHWGCNVGLELENGRLSTSHHERLNDNKLRSMVEDLLRIIHDILKSDERFDQSGNGKAGLSSNVASSRANQPRRTRERVARSRTSRVIWARGGGQGRPYSASYAAGIAGPAFVQPGPPDRERTQRDQRTCPMRGPHKSLVRSAKPWGQERNSNMNGWSSFSSRFKLSGKLKRDEKFTPGYWASVILVSVTMIRARKDCTTPAAGFSRGRHLPNGVPRARLNYFGSTDDLDLGKPFCALASLSTFRPPLQNLSLIFSCRPTTRVAMIPTTSCDLGSLSLLRTRT